ncbi:hypothetical protein BSM4216_0536 [Bacillus smithii]|nr:hypothetical protein BSM4216_0536 [Bacillus smithii]
MKIGFFALSIEFLYGKENFMLKRVINAIDCFYFLSISLNRNENLFAYNW